MELKDALNLVTDKYMGASQLADVVIGTVLTVGPLTIQVNGMSDVLREPVLYLTVNVVEKKIPILTHSHNVEGLSHSHTVSGLGHGHNFEIQITGQDGTQTASGQTETALTGSYPTSTALEDLSETGAATDSRLSHIVCYENGQALPVENGYIILNRALEAGDKVLMLRVQNGQRFLILSRIFEELIT